MTVAPCDCDGLPAFPPTPSPPTNQPPPPPPHLHTRQVGRPQLKPGLRPGGLAKLGSMASGGLALLERSCCSSPMLEQMAQQQQQQGKAGRSTTVDVHVDASGAAAAAAAAAAQGAMAAAAAATAAVGALDVRRLASNQSEATGGGGQGDELDWLLEKQPGSAAEAEAREFELLFGGAGGGLGGGSAVARGCGFSPTAGLLFSPSGLTRNRPNLFSPRFRRGL